MQRFGRLEDDPFLSRIDCFGGCRDHARPEDRLRAARRAAERLREQMLSGPVAPFYRSISLVKVPYPVRYGLLDASLIPAPYLAIENRFFVVQVERAGVKKTVLLSPTDVDRSAETPFFRDLRRSMGPFQSIGEKIIAKKNATVDSALASLGLDPARVDYLSYDHLHTQDVRRWLGPGGLFPNAKLLVMRREWESAHGHLPQHRQWYCPNGLEGIDPSRVVLLDDDVMVGDSLAIVRTPGHTEGNHSFVAHTPEGLMVTSENGIGPDAYAPLASRIPGVARYARRTGMEVILNGNTLESSVDQYISMVVEKTIAGPSLRHPDFMNTVCSSELSTHWALPGIVPTFCFGDLSFGNLEVKPRASAEVAAHPA